MQEVVPENFVFPIEAFCIGVNKQQVTTSATIQQTLCHLVQEMKVMSHFLNMLQLAGPSLAAI